MTARGRAQWDDLSDRQKKQFGGDKKAFKAAKKAVAKSGGDASSVKSIKNTHRAPSPSPSPSRSPSPSHSSSSSSSRPSGTPSKVSNISAYDRTSYGSGHHKGTDKLSRADIKELHENQGFSKQEVIDYVEGNWASGSKGGLKAKNLLERYKQDLKNSGAVETVAPPPPAPAPTQGRTEEIRNRITPDMYQSPKPERIEQEETKNENRIDINDIRIEGGDGDSISIDQSNSQTFENWQDNDIVTSITGDNNTVNNEQDNSIRNYGGDQVNDATVGFADSNYVTGISGTDFGTGNRNVAAKQSNAQKFKNTQDNDIITDIYGDGNTVNNTQDNSMRNYGGYQRSTTMADFLRRAGL